MKKLTKKEKNNIYRKVYNVCLTKEWFKDEFICNQIEAHSDISKSYIFEYFPEFELFRPNNHIKRDPFLISIYNEGNDIKNIEFQPIQAIILAFCIAMTE